MTEALLALADGSLFRGISIGAEGETVGEAVFNTAITGYQEILTDPSYCQQIVTLTYPHIGNYGVNDEDVEAAKVHAAGLIIRDLPLIVQAVAWLLFLPVMVGLWVWETTWPLIVRLLVVLGLAGWNLLVFLPKALQGARP